MSFSIEKYIVGVAKVSTILTNKFVCQYSDTERIVDVNVFKHKIYIWKLLES